MKRVKAIKALVQSILFYRKMISAFKTTYLVAQIEDAEKAILELYSQGPIGYRSGVTLYVLHPGKEGFLIEDFCNSFRNAGMVDMAARGHTKSLLIDLEQDAINRLEDL